MEKIFDKWVPMSERFMGMGRQMVPMFVVTDLERRGIWH
jgi:hypothetical protein